MTLNSGEPADMSMVATVSEMNPTSIAESPGDLVLRNNWTIVIVLTRAPTAATLTWLPH